MGQQGYTRDGPPETPAAPLAADELEPIFAPLRAYRRVVLAVSGGADSIALLQLAARWKAMGGGKRLPELEVATVDHGLRPASAEEARWVAAQARALGLKHATLVWGGKKPATGIEEAGREARYRLLREHAQSLEDAPVAVATAHTEDDQGETFLMRLARGSGLDGLSCMAPRRRLVDDADVDLVRPLLGVPRSRLVATLRAAAISWLDDPSNESLDYERVRLRAASAELSALGLTNSKLALSARRLARAREALDLALAALLASSVKTHDGIFAEIDRGKWAAASAELRIRLLVRVLSAFGGAARAARLAQVESLADMLSASNGAGKHAAWTLGGCMIRGGARSIRIFREETESGLPEIDIEPGGHTLWDSRFHVSLAPMRVLRTAGIKTPVVVRALGQRAYATLRACLEHKPRAPARAVASVPSFWSGDTLLAVPQLGFTSGGLRSGYEGRPSSLCVSEFVGLRPVG